MTSSGLRLSRQQFFHLIHSCNEINQANCKSREFNPWIWQLWCGPLLVREIWQDVVWACFICGSHLLGQFSLRKLRRCLKLPVQRSCGWQKSSHAHGKACATSHAMSPLKGLKPTNRSVSCDWTGLKKDLFEWLKFPQAQSHPVPHLWKKHIPSGHTTNMYVCPRRFFTDPDFSLLHEKG